ncbi:MAG: hypothetical protein LBT29_03405 [Flavobacteriaceae bacterium]|jgi:hypothetical protein|nr:hypothetical protein [Flavobacteriaceae bacterium]
MSEPRFSQDFKNQQKNPANLNKIKVQDNAGNRDCRADGSIYHSTER